MLVKDLLKGIDIVKISNSEILNEEIENVSINTNKITDNSAFILIIGTTFNPYDKVEDIYKTGKVKLFISEKELPGKPYILLKNCREALGIICKNFYNIDLDKFLLIGVTGTNGKTTTNYIMDSILTKSGRKTIRIGTTEYKVLDKVLEANNTTPGTYELFEIIHEGSKKGADSLCMEVSSHALDQNRAAGLKFDTAIFTNLTGDHLDYHKTMEEYYAAKRKLFTEQASKSAVINIDHEYGKRLFEETKIKKISFSTIKGDVSAENPKYTLDGIKTVININGYKLFIESTLVGKHNLENILGAVAAAYMLGIDYTFIKEGVEAVRNIPGRLEKFEKDGRYFFVDYAHTDDALKNVLEALSTFKKKRIITVFGCGGDRDRTKRPRMAKVAENFSDIVIVTSDNPRTEDPLAIINEILSGFSSMKNVLVEPDRRKAIEKAVTISENEDIVLIAGKGHEDYQIIGKVKHHFDDREEICRNIGVKFEKH